MPVPDGSPVRLAITLGDPRGIGPEVVQRALAGLAPQDAIQPVIVGPRGLTLSVDEAIGDWNPSDSSKVAGNLAGRAIEHATKLALAGDVHGIVTAPVDKQALLQGGYDVTGHTEMLAALTGCDVAMMLASAKLRVVLVTTHIALRDVVHAVTSEAISRIARVTTKGLREWFDIARPRLALCALNPHAGDGGRFGNEDDVILAPAARAAGIAGPYPADTVFVRALRGEFDAVLAPYHDVGMTAIKVASFGSAVNVTLGLPFPRTSPDHGTAIDIVGKGIADGASMSAAVRLCADIARRVVRKNGIVGSNVARSRP